MNSEHKRKPYPVRTAQ